MDFYNLCTNPFALNLQIYDNVLQTNETGKNSSILKLFIQEHIHKFKKNVLFYKINTLPILSIPCLKSRLLLVEYKRFIIIIIIYN